MLDYDIRQPASPNNDAPLIVLMHGRGANRSDLASLADHMPPDATVVFPEAPFPAAPWGYGPGSAWYQFLGRNKPEPESFTKSLEELHELIRKLENSKTRKLIVGGFSQGGTMGIAYALTHPQQVTGVLNFSGFLADHPRVFVNERTVNTTSFFWGHGRHDPSIPFDLASEGRQVLRAAGATVVAHDYDIGHWIDAQELDDAVQWLATL